MTNNTTQNNTNDINDYINDDISDDISDNETENLNQTPLDNNYQNYNNNRRQIDLLEFENSINETMHNVIYIMNQMDNRDKSWKKLNKISQMLADISILASRII